MTETGAAVVGAMFLLILIGQAALLGEILSTLRRIANVLEKDGKSHD